MMSDHLCSMNETLSKQREEIDTLKMSSKVCAGRGVGTAEAAGRRHVTVMSFKGKGEEHVLVSHHPEVYFPVQKEKWFLWLSLSCGLTCCLLTFMFLCVSEGDQQMALGGEHALSVEDPNAICGTLSKLFRSVKSFTLVNPQIRVSHSLRKPLRHLSVPNAVLSVSCTV